MTDHEVMRTAGPLQSRVMGDPCPHCGGTDYYCMDEADRYIDHLLIELGASGRQYTGASSALTSALSELTEARAEIEQLETELLRRIGQVDAGTIRGIGAESKVERLRLLCAHAAEIMTNYGNMINWPANVPQEYAATISALRRAANIEGAA